MEACLVTTDYFRAMNIPLKRDATLMITTIDPLSRQGPQQTQRNQKGLCATEYNRKLMKSLPHHWPNEDPIGSA